MLNKIIALSLIFLSITAQASYFGELSQPANKVMAGPTGGGAAPVTFRSLVAADIPALAYSSSTLTSTHLFVGNGGNVATDVAASGDVSLANTGAFTVSSVGASSAANIHSAELAANAATAVPTASTISKWDASSNMSANAFFVSTYVDYTQIATPASPAANHDRCYVKNDDKFYCKSSAGVETLIGPSGFASPLAIASGGTGQTTKTAAFDALSPLSTKGDTVVHNGTNNIRFPACSDGQQIQFDSSQASGIKCMTPGGVAQLYGELTYPTTAGCQFSASNGAFANFSAVVACAAPTVTGSVVAPATKVPGVKLVNAPPGDYYIVASGNWFSSGGPSAWTISDGTTTSGYAADISGVNLSDISGHFTYGATQASVTFQMQTLSSGGGSAQIYVDNTSSLAQILQFKVYYFPSTAPNALVTTSNPVQVVLSTARITNGGAAAISRQDGSWITSATRTAVGRVTLALPTPFLSNPMCTCTAEVEGRVCSFTSADPTNATILVATTIISGADEDDNFHIFCLGPK